MPAQPHPRAGWSLVALSAVVIAALTLSPDNTSTGPREFLLLVPSATDVIYNILLFVPLGIGLALTGAPIARIAAWSGFISALIEAMQWAWIPSRYATLGDIVANTAGALAGGLLLRLSTRALLPSRQYARVASYLSALVWVIVNIGAGAMLRLDVPATPTWWGQWAHTFPTTVPLNGQVLAMTFDGLPIPDDALPNTAEIKSRLRARGSRLSVMATVTAPSRGRAQVAALTDGNGNLITAVELEGCTLRLVDRRRGETIGFRMLALNLAERCPDASDTLAITTTSTHGIMAMEVRSQAGSVSDSLPVTPAAAWRLLATAPRHISHPELWGTIWIAFFLVPLGYWSTFGWASRSVAALLAVVVAGTGAMYLSAAVFGLAWPLWSEVAAVGSGGLAGWLGGHAVAIRRRPPASSATPVRA